MKRTNLLACVTMFALAASGCATRAPVLPPQELVCPKPPAPPSWLMQKAPDLLLPLNGLISISETGSPQPKSK